MKSLAGFLVEAWIRSGSREVSGRLALVETAEEAVAEPAAVSLKVAVVTALSV